MKPLHLQQNPAPDHHALGRQLDVYATDPQVGAGLPLWLPAG